MQNISLQPADITDIPTIQELIHKIWKPTYKDILSDEQMDYMLEMMYSSAVLIQQFETGHHFVLIYLNNKPVGFAGYQLDATEKGVCKLHKIYTLPEVQGKGIGLALFNYVKEQAIKANQYKLMLNVNRYNKAAGFYHKLGMAIEAEVDVAIGNGYFMNDYIMGITL